MSHRMYPEIRWEDLEDRPLYATLNEVAADMRDLRRFRVPPSKGTPKKVFINCHYCGYSPSGSLPADGVCPKCKGASWERFTLARQLVPAHMG